MLSQEYLPSVRDLVKVDNLPDNLGFLTDALGNLMDKVYYRNLIEYKSVNGDNASYNVDLVLLRELKLVSIPGTDIELILNPPPIGSSTIGETSFNVSLAYKWEILRFLRGAKLSAFSFSVKGFLELLAGIFGISTEEMIEETINVFIGNLANPPFGQDPLQDFVDHYNANYDPDITSYVDLADVITQVQANHSILEIVVNDFLDDAFEKLEMLITKWVGPLNEERLKQLVIPEFAVSVNDLDFALTLPRSVFIPLDVNNNDTPYPDPIRSRIEVTAGTLGYDTTRGLYFDDNLSFSFTKSEILNSGFTLEINDLKVDLSETTNIPEADADGRPLDFKGVYVRDATIGFPAFWQHNDGASTGELVAREMLIGTGGMSGTIALQAKTSGTPSPLIEACFGSGFTVALDTFSMKFQQNALLETDIKGSMKIPGFKDATGTQDAEIDIAVNIERDGDFSVTASEPDGIKIKIPNILDFIIYSAKVGREDDRFYLAVSGLIDFGTFPAPLGQFLPDAFEIQELIIWDDGQIEFKGGKITLPNAISLKLGPVALSVTAIGLGSHEQEYQGNLRQYKYFTFDGSVGVNPGGVDVSGNGVSFYWTTDDDNFGGNGHFFVRIQSIAIDLIIPGSATPETAALLLKGFLSMKSPENGGNGTEYAGGVEFTLPKLKMGGSAAMRLNPKIPAFLVDVGLELSAPIVLGSTGLGIYGFRALVGQRYVASKSSIPLADDAPWWQYYKAKIPNQYKEGIQVDKFSQEDGFSLGAGVSLATAPDAGRAFSSKLFFLLSLPDVFLFQGQGQILKERIGLDTTQDPPFFALIAITSTSIETAFGVNYKIPDDGKIATLDGVLEMGFFWGNAASWYINIGKDQPENRRIQARILNLFNAYFYLMLSANGIKAGAGASYELDKKFGPLRAELRAYLDVAGRISFKPKQIGGSINIGGSVGLYIWRFGFKVSAHAGLAAEAPRPFIVSGHLKACVRVLRKDRCANFNFTWTFNNNLNQDEIEILNPSLKDAAKAVNINTRETFDLYTSAGSGLPSKSSLENYIIPMDSYIDIEFQKGVLPSSSVQSIVGGNSQAVEYIDYSAPQKGKSDRVRHEFKLNDIEIFCYNTTSNSWVSYDVYDAATPLDLAPFVTTNLNTLKTGYWQYQSPNLHNKLRILAMSPLSYVSQGSGGIIPENSGITVESIFCEPDPVPKICVDFDTWDRPDLGSTQDGPLLPVNTHVWHEHMWIWLTQKDGTIVNRPYSNLDHALRIQEGEQMHILFTDAKPCVDIRLDTTTWGTTVYYYERVPSGGLDSSGMPIYVDQLITTQYLAPGAPDTLAYLDLDRPVSYVVIESGICEEQPGGGGGKDVPLSASLEEFLRISAENQLMAAGDFEVYPRYEELYGDVLAGSLFPEMTEGHELLVSATEDSRTGLTLRLRDTGSDYVETFILHSEEAPQGFRYLEITGFANIAQPEGSEDPRVFEITAYYGEEQSILLTGVAEVTEIYKDPKPEGEFPPEVPPLPTYCNPELTEYANDILGYLNALAQNRILNENLEMSNQPWYDIFNGTYFNTSLYGDPIRNKAEVVSRVIFKDENAGSISWEITDNHGFRCQFNLEAIPPQRIDFANDIVSFSNLRYDPYATGPGWVYTFLVDVRLGNGDTITMRGTSCYPIMDCRIECNTFIYQICYQDYEQVMINQTIPTQSQINAETSTMINAFNGSIQPIWRPNTYYAIRISTNDEGYRENNTSLYFQHAKQKVFAFRTAGPVGHFHIYKNSSGNDVERPEYQALQAQDREDEYKLAKLLHYLDLPKCFPNGDGQLINAKPVYFEDPKLLLFYKHAYVYEMMRDWDTYQGNGQVKSQMEVQIKDPAPDPNVGANSPVIAGWVENRFPIVSEDITQLSNMITYGIPCAIVTQIDPLGVTNEFQLPILKPLKLYTAIFNVRYERPEDSSDTLREVHRYGFQTSRYGNFTDHIQSWKLVTNGSTVVKAAVFKVEKAFESSQITTAQTELNGTLASGDPLRQTFMDPFDRLINGIFKMQALEPAETTEFNAVIDDTTGNCLGILVRSPEPFNDPKMPESELADTIELTLAGSSSYKAVFSKDRSMAFVTHTNNSMNLPITGNTLDWQFKLKLWDGNQYSVVATETLSFDIA